MTQSTHRWRFSRILHLTLLVAGIAVASGAAVAHARPTQPNASDRQITFAVSTLMERHHLTGHKLDDTISERMLKTFVKDLDPLKLFFYQSDIDEFNGARTSSTTRSSMATSASPTKCSRVSWHASMNASRWPRPS